MNKSYKNVRMEVRSRNDNIEIDALRTVSVGLGIKIQLISILVNTRPKISSIKSEHDVSDSLSLNNLFVNEVIDEALGERNTLIHIRFLHFKNQIL